MGMGTPMNTLSLSLQLETLTAMDKINSGTIAYQSNQTGIRHAEPLIIAMDGLLRYAKAYKRRFYGELAKDYVLDL